MSYQLIHGDCLAVMAVMDAASIDAVVCDPPYGLEFMGKSWDKLDGGGGKASARAMQEWHEAWAVEALRVLKPSHYLLAFGGTRTWHRLACAIEDAGFEIRDTLMWLYGSGFPKGKACLKPAWEPIILARKPGPMRELGIEECRIAHQTVNGGNLADNSHLRQSIKHTNSAFGCNGDAPMHPAGRWPANVILDEAAAGLVDGQTGERRSAGDYPSDSDTTGMFGVTQGHLYADSGGASRFYYCAKASRSERNAGCEGLEAKVKDAEYRQPTGNPLVDRIHGCGVKAVNHHPTVKPLSLMQWLVRLVARPGDVVLDPFTGSGTTGVACAKEGRNFIGIEREAEYVEIARRRIEAASAQERLPV